jgi:thiol-disulfide isomerase/thioredoxin
MIHRIPFALSAALALSALLLAACAGGSTAEPTSPPADTPDVSAASPEPTASLPEDPTPADADSTTPELDERFIGQIPAPDFPTDLEWINTDSPISLRDLRGKVVLIDFWTYGCINCIHMLPVLEQLEKKYADELVVIGVHSAKFENEGQTENLRQIVERYGITHPVLNDNEFEVWNAYRINAWPSFAIIDPRGNLLALDAGEIPFDAFDEFIGGVVSTFEMTGELDRTPLDLAAGPSGPQTALRFPGKVLADPAGGRLYIADSNHHRIVVADLATYEVLDVIGGGGAGLSDGDYVEARFHTPQGLALDGSTLYVADTNNHAIRAVDLDTRQVTTIAGTGERGTQTPTTPGVPIPDPTTVALRSPWDVAMGDGVLYIAMAGTHQIWTYDPAEDVLIPTVGTSRESLINGPLGESALAQPSGLFFRDDVLYFADSESSSVRAADFGAGEVRTLAGPPDNTLFAFGDRDGVAGDSRLQHPLGVAGGPDGPIYVADTYNSRIKAIDPSTDTITTLFGLGGDGGFADGGPDVAAFDEPGGLDYADGLLYVADTNNHAIRVIDLAAGVVSTVEFPNPEALRLPESDVMVAGGQPVEADQTLDAQTAAPGDGEIVLALDLPEGFKINDLTDSTGVFTTQGAAISLSADAARQVITGPELRIPVTFTEGNGSVTADLTLYYCREGQEALCFIDMATIEAPVTVSPDGADAIRIEHAIVPPEGI